MRPVPHTFLFTDLVGYTALADIEGDDRAAEVALELQRRVRALLPGFGGEEVKALGDGIMLRCADPAAAIKLGLRIVATLEDDPAFPLVRIGIHSGEAVAHDGDWYGRTVNVAARLCAVAPGRRGAGQRRHAQRRGAHAQGRLRRAPPALAAQRHRARRHLHGARACLLASRTSAPSSTARRRRASRPAGPVEAV